MSTIFKSGLMFIVLGASVAVYADEVKILNAEFEHANGQWTAHVTLKHGDTGWEHYADAWRIVDNKGKVMGTRTLYHPHVDEQPFTRSLSGINIPSGTNEIFVEAHDKVHGWSTDRVRVDLGKASGKRYKIRR